MSLGGEMLYSNTKKSQIQKDNCFWIVFLFLWKLFTIWWFPKTELFLTISDENKIKLLMFSQLLIWTRLTLASLTKINENQHRGVGCTHVSGCTSHRTQNHKLAPYFEEENSALVMSLLAEKKETFIIEKVLAWWSLVCLKGDLSIQLSK